MQKTGFVFDALDAPQNAAMQILIHLYVAAKAFCGAFGLGSFVLYQGAISRFVGAVDDLDYEIEFQDVSFRYPRTDAWALRHISMKFKIGDKIAIFGENGSGKTTLIKLFCRRYDPTEGKILLNGIDITRYRYEEYLGLFSVVFQDFNLSGFSLGDNVSAGLGYDEAKARDCLERAGMGEKLKGLDQKGAEEGKYRELWDAQAGYYRKEGGGRQEALS